MPLPFNIFDRFKQQISELHAASDPDTINQLQDDVAQLQSDVVILQDEIDNIETATDLKKIFLLMGC